MKLFATLTILVSVVLASPLARRQSPSLYTLKITGPTLKELDGQYLSSSNGTVGVFTEASPLQVYLARSDESEETYSLHTYPMGIIDHAIGLVGSTGVLQLNDITNPAGVTNADWNSFVLDNSTSAISYVGEGGSWAAFPNYQGDWRATWKTSEAMTTNDYMPFKLLLESVETAAT